MHNDPYRNAPPGAVPPSPGGVPPHHGRPRTHRSELARRAPLLVILGGLLSLMLLLAVWYNRGTNQATRDLRSANELVAEKQRAVLEARQVLEQRVAELRAAEAQVAVGAERLDVELVRDRKGEVDAGEVEPLDTVIVPRRRR